MPKEIRSKADPSKIASYDCIGFKSASPFYDREKRGSKSNTVRKLPIGDEREDVLREWRSMSEFGIIKIIKDDKSEAFKRKVTDVSFFNDEFVVISWNPISEVEDGDD